VREERMRCRERRIGKTNKHAEAAEVLTKLTGEVSN
jgi:hypothetical protein